MANRWRANVSFASRRGTKAADGSPADEGRRNEFPHGVLEMLILKTLALGPDYGGGIAHRIRQISGEHLKPGFDSIYPALHRLELRGEVESQSSCSTPRRQAKVYGLTATGRRQLTKQTTHWNQFVTSVDLVLDTEPA